MYKYFPDVEAILLAWHEQEITGHLAHLADLRDRSDDAASRIEVVLQAYALLSHGSHGHHRTELGAFLHRSEALAHAQQQLRGMIRDLLVEGVEAGVVRHDVAAAELASYCLDAISGAASLPSKAAVRRLVAVTLAGLRPSVGSGDDGAGPSRE